MSFIAQKMKFSFKDFFSKCDQIRRKLWIWSHSLKKSLKENFLDWFKLAIGLQGVPSRRSNRYENSSMNIVTIFKKKDPIMVNNCW